MASLTNEQLTRYATMPAAINQTRKSASQPTKPTSSTPPPLNTSNESEPNPPTATATLEESNLSDLSDPETKDPRTWKRPSKKRKRPSSVVNIDDLQSVFHYDGATRRNMAPKIVYPQDQQILGRLTTQPWIQEAQKLQMEEKKEKRAKTSNTTTTHKSKNDDENDDLRFTHPFAPTLVAPPKKNLMPLKDRKRFFIYTPTPTILRAMATHVSEIHALFPPSYPIGHCMLHPSPPPCHIDGRARQTLTYNYAWKDRGGGGGGVRGGGGGEGVHEVKVNYGIIALLVNSRLSAVQKEGWIEESWHLSHLCGNWICCNWRHYTVEDGPTNISRNACFASTKECKHKPPCMKDKKQKLILPPHKSKQNPPTLPGMTVVDAEEAEKVVESPVEDSMEEEGSDEEIEIDAEKEEGLKYCSTSEDVTEVGSESDGDDGGGVGEGGVKGSEDEDDTKAPENPDAPSATKKTTAQPDIIVLSSDSETESESADSKTDGQ